MQRIRIEPTRADRALANAIAAHTHPPVEAASRFVTWGADEKVLLAAAGAAWVYAARQPRLRPLASHFLALSLASAILPHLLKHRVDQTRPDRLTVRGHWRGVPLSGRTRDAFPSGHAVHMGALASAAGLLSKPYRAPVRILALALSATRIVLLAHWASDVVAGFVLGALLERGLRPFTFRKSRQETSAR
jgi:membrane-associated phospholipid phosphatase